VARQAGSAARRTGLAAGRDARCMRPTLDRMADLAPQVSDRRRVGEFAPPPLPARHRVCNPLRWSDPGRSGA
jgi:hypothetical protein